MAIIASVSIWCTSTSVATMTNIPLLCNICPKNPEFSDVSHLLTHVASKGHLSQHSKAKLRSHQDASFREKLEAYERWYQRHQIERLLSERMIAKDSKDSSGRARSNKPASRSTALAKVTESRKRRARTAEKPEHGPSPVKLEGLIDPQLSHPDRAAAPSNDGFPSFIEQPSIEDNDNRALASPTLPATNHQISSTAFLSQPQHRYSHKAPTPYMSRWQEASSPLYAISTEARLDSKGKLSPTQVNEIDGENDYFENFLRSPTRTAYPDPSELPGFRTAFSNRSSSSIIKDDDMGHFSQDLDSKDGTSKSMELTLQSPVLRGIKWPGMSIFDSASMEAQRLRNQKKTGSVIEQMEYNSATVEQLERIYWPDGSLKMQRLITGDVESSPPRELTPPPKPSKRRRTKVANSVLTDLSTNNPNRSKRSRARKSSSRIPAIQACDLQNISHKALASLDPPRSLHPSNTYTGYNPAEDDEIERRLTSGLPMNTRRRGFDVFDDQKGSRRNVQSDLITRSYENATAQASHSHQPTMQAHVSTETIRRISRSSTPGHSSPQFGVPSQRPSRESQVRNIPSRPQSSFMDMNKENIGPVLDSDGHVHDEAANNNQERITQRYFWVTGNQPPQFFSSMPPGMDFGGLVEPRYYGSTLNPLNPYLRQQHPVPPQAYAAPISQPPGPSMGTASNIENLMQQDLRRSSGGSVYSRPCR